MKDNIISLFISTRAMTFLLLLFASSMAAGTIIESYYDTATSKIWIYNAWWFEVVMLLLVLNFMGSIKRYQLFRWKKWATLTMHLSWIFIIVGAGITRYISFEGVMLIREGETEEAFFSDTTYFSAIMQGEDANGKPMQRTVDESILISPHDYSTVKTLSFYDKKIEIIIDSLIYDAVEGLKETEEGGERYLKIVEAGAGTRHDHLLKDGEEASIHGVLFGVNIDPAEATKKGLINIIENWDGYQLQTPYEGDYLRMADQQKGTVVKDSTQPLQLRSLYTMAGMQFVIPQPILQGEVAIIKSPEPTAAKQLGLLCTLKVGDEEQKVELLGGKGMVNDYVEADIAGLKLYLRYGSKDLKLPFSITLEDFIAAKHPGTEKSYASFESKVIVNDGDQKSKEHIYMNNVLDKDGYRFFQAGFDPDELGTHLSVNYDFWGKTVTYVGYMLLYLAMMALIVDPNTRFGELRRLIDRVNTRKAKQLSMIAILLTASIATAQEVHGPDDGHGHEVENVKQPLPQDAQVAEGPIFVPQFALRVLDSAIVANMVPVAQAARFGRVVVQDNGRMKPVSTIASELLRKISERDYYEAVVDGKKIRLTPEQTLLSMVQMKSLWFHVPIIKLKRGNDSLRDILGIDRSRTYAAGYDFFRNKDGSMGSFKLNDVLDDANAANIKNAFQKDFIDINYSLGLLDQTIVGSILKVFPKEGADNSRWYAYPEVDEAAFEDPGQEQFVREFFNAYSALLIQGNLTGNYLKANTALSSLMDYQRRFGGEVMLSDDKIEAEILYNEYDIFKGIYKWYIWFGIIMLVLLIVEIIRPMKEIRYSIIFHKWIIGSVFLVHTAGLGLRWYLSGHAPWSDAYESLIYVAWATMAFGLMFGRKSEMTIASTAFVVSIILWVAQLNWLDPAIANLQPVLDSYWLMIHVAVIVGSYGPFALGMILGVVTLLLMIFATAKNKKKIDLNIKELVYINEVSLTVGLIMLTIGNFLGGMWANESWGRYWGWDPKETWALITIFVYAFVLHLRLVPGLKSRWTFSLWSILAFYSVIMTYFGVNFYLTGLHSYASGERLFSFQAAGISMAIVVAFAIVARWKEGKIYGKEKV
jgi:cytochrome c-type biogenesis protein CcsB